VSLNRSTGKLAVRRAVTARGGIAAMGAGAALAVALQLGGAGLAVAGTHRDPRAVEIANAVEQAVAPGGGWEKVAALQFNFRVAKDGEVKADYRHLWDVRTGKYRVDWTEPDGSGRCVIFDIATKQGKAYRHLLPPVARKPGGEEEPLPNPIAGWFSMNEIFTRKLVQDAYARFVNDSYWLLMPLKMKDPGVNLDYDGEVKRDGETYDVVKLTFDHVGLTPGDTYWVFVNRRTHLVDRWEYILQDEGVAKEKDADAPKAAGPAPATGGEKPKSAPATPAAGAESGKQAGSAPAAAAPPAAPERTAWTWTDWQSFGPLTLATTKSRVGGSVVIQFRNVEVLKEIPAGAFDPPK
jgi:hypothetical protein